MLKKCLSIALITSMVCTLCGVTAFANTKGDSEAQRIEKVKNDVRNLGVGPDALVKLKLRDKTKLEGYISAVAEDSFEVTDLRTGVAMTVAYRKSARPNETIFPTAREPPSWLASP